MDMGVLSAAELGREQGVQASSLRGKIRIDPVERAFEEIFN